MCHITSKPKTKAEKKKLVAPTILLSMESVTAGINVLEESKTNRELKKRTIEFLRDYIYNPIQDKSYCEDMAFDKYAIMPSLKGFITPKELDLLLPWLYDNFAPQKYRIKPKKILKKGVKKNKQ